MTEAEREIMKDAYYYLNTYSDNAKNDDILEFQAACADLSVMIGHKWKCESLAQFLFPTLYLYLIDKAKEGKRERGEMPWPKPM